MTSPCPRGSKEELEGDWKILRDGWKTPYRAVSWSYSTQRRVHNVEPPAKPPHYHDHLFYRPPAELDQPASRGGTSTPHTALEDSEVNPDLVGVKMATDVVQLYEADVGFHAASCDSLVSKSSPVPWLPAPDEQTVELGRRWWQELAQDLVGGVVDGKGFDELSLLNFGLRDGSTPSTPSFVDLSDSDRSAHSLPSTPGANGSDATAIRSKEDYVPEDRSHRAIYSSSSQRSDGSASSILNVTPPSKPTHVSPLLTSFPNHIAIAPPSPTLTFPALDPSMTHLAHSLFPPLALQKDEQGFWNEVKLTPSPTQSVPSSHTLQRPTRHTHSPLNSTKPNRITKASTAPGHSEKSELSYKFLSGDGDHLTYPPPSPIERDSDGWILSTDAEDEAKSKAQRAKNLFLALGRHRPSDSPDDHLSSRTAASAPNSSVQSLMKSLFTAESGVSSEPAAGVSRSSDGWIEGPSQAKPPRYTRRVAPPTPQPHPAAGYPTFALPTAPLSHYPTVYSTPYAAAAYMQMQVQMQMQALVQQGFTPFHAPVPVYPVGPLPPPQAATLHPALSAPHFFPTGSGVYYSSATPALTLPPDVGMAGALGLRHAIL
jgi:hypothetical protein